MLGGTFNPPHRGHLALASHARQQLALGCVLLMPAHTPPFKADGRAGAGALAAAEHARDPGPEHRLAMCRLAVQGLDGVAVCALEIQRGGVSYTVDTLEQLHASHPHARLTLILGADVASTLSSWREPAQLLALARLAVARRPGAPAAPLPAGARVTVLDMPAIDVSSSLVRQRVSRGEGVEDLVGGAVAGYIAEHDLYRVGAGAGV